jgi:hypothetical protein
MLCSLVFRLRSSLNLTLADESWSVPTCFMNSFHCSGTINWCLVNGSSPFLIKYNLRWNLNCLHALAAVFQKSLNTYGFASSWNFKCFCTCLSNKSHFSSLLSSLISGKFKGIYCLAASPASTLNLCFWVNGTGIPTMSTSVTIIVSLGHFVDVLGALPRRWASPIWSCCALAVP